MYFYTEESRGEINLAILHRLDPTKQYLRHYDNLLFLQFVFAHPGSSRVEKHQASKEITICERKLKYWERNATFNKPASILGVEELKRKWTGGKGLKPE